MELTVGSFPVANVQALAVVCRDTGDVPHSYIRPEVHTHSVVTLESEGVDVDVDVPVIDFARLLDHSSCDVDVPVIDFARLLDPSSCEDESSKLHLACENWGFCQLINHSVPDQVIERMKLDVEEFFRLPLEEKRQLAQVTGNLQGYGQLFVVSEEQKLDWADVLYLDTLPAPSRYMRFWPTQPPSFRAALDKYSAELKNLADCLLNIMSKNLGLSPDVVTDEFKVGIQSVRFNYYPPCPQADKVLGFSQHSDADLITLVLQVNQVQGLQIKRSGRWIPVKPLHDSFIVNVGDIFEIFSNGRYKSIEHRVVVDTERERLSIATFHSPKADAMIGPLQELATGSGAKYKTVDHENFMRLFFSSKLDGKNFLDRMRCER